MYRVMELTSFLLKANQTGNQGRCIGGVRDNRHLRMARLFHRNGMGCECAEAVCNRDGFVLLGTRYVIDM